MYILGCSLPIPRLSSSILSLRHVLVVAQSLLLSVEYFILIRVHFLFAFHRYICEPFHPPPLLDGGIFFYSHTSDAVSIFFIHAF